MLALETCVCISLVKYATLKAVAAAQSRPEKRCTRDLQRQLLKPDFRLLRILVDSRSFCDRSRLLPTWRQQADRLFCALYHGFCGKGAKINGFWCACHSTRGRLCCSHPSFQPSLSGNALAVGQLVPGVAPARTCGPGSYTVPTQHGSKYPSYVPFSTSTQRGFEMEQSSHEVLLNPYRCICCSACCPCNCTRC